MLEIKDLCVSYGAIDAVKGISLKVNDGEIVSLIGANGAGKTTTLHTITGLVPAKSGSITYDGHDLLKTHANKIVTLGMAHVPEGRHVFTRMSVQENLEMGAFSLKDQSSLGKDLEMVFDYFPRLKERRRQLAGTLSGGEQQRVAIAIALSNNPKLLLADEPTGSVDTATSKLILDVFRELNRAMGVTIIIVTHDTKLSAQIDRVVAIRDGKTSTELVRKSGIAKSFGELNEQEETSHEELTVLDRAGRLQIPKEYLEELGLRGGDKVRVELEEGKISIYPRGIADKASK